jgi:hypothetical protein
LTTSPTLLLRVLSVWIRKRWWFCWILIDDVLFSKDSHCYCIPSNDLFPSLPFFQTQFIARVLLSTFLQVHWATFPLGFVILMFVATIFWHAC